MGRVDLIQINTVANTKRFDLIQIGSNVDLIQINRVANSKRISAVCADDFFWQAMKLKLFIILSFFLFFSLSLS